MVSGEGCEKFFAKTCTCPVSAAHTQSMSVKNTAAKAPSFVTNNRRPVGTPGAGRWTETVRPEADLSLALHPADAEKAERISNWEDRRAATAELLSQYTNPEALTKQVQDAADYFVQYYDQARKSNHVDAQDIRQETLEVILRMVNSGKPISNIKAVAASVAANLTVRATENKFRAEDRRAYVMYTSKCEALGRELGRSLTQREEDAVAQNILDTWDKPRHRPSKDFRTPRTVDSSIFLDSDEGFSLADTLAEHAGVDRYVAPDSFMDRAFDEVEQVGSAHKAAARRLMFNALAERTGVPLAREGSLSQRQVTKHRAAMGEEPGAINQALEDWGQGIDTPATQALFAPFGDLNISEQIDVTNFLEGHGERAGEMWASALAFANNKHARKSDES